MGKGEKIAGATKRRRAHLQQYHTGIGAGIEGRCSVSSSYRMTLSVEKKGRRNPTGKTTVKKGETTAVMEQKSKLP